MSTRANIIVTKGETKCFSYHHSDGFPEGVGQELLDWLKLKKFNTDSPEEFCIELEKYDDEYVFDNIQHSDVEYVYYVDLDNRTYMGYEMTTDKNGRYDKHYWDYMSTPDPYPEEKIKDTRYLCLEDKFGN